MNNHKLLLKFVNLLFVFNLLLAVNITVANDDKEAVKNFNTEDWPRFK